MKFTDGYWMMKPEMEAVFATEYYASVVKEREAVKAHEKGIPVMRPMVFEF